MSDFSFRGVSGVKALIVFGKLPVAGQVKTRLTPPLKPDEAARLYEAFLQDALASYQTLGLDVRLYLSPPLDSIPPDLIPESISVYEQRGEGLGLRMQQAFLETFASGYERAVVIGTDHPTLPLSFIHYAFDALEKPLSTCIGPAGDGGYYLLGMNEFYPQLFEGAAYSHPSVFEEAVERILQVNAGLTILPSWYDVDTMDALHRLNMELQDVSIPVPRTRKMMDRLAAEYPQWLAPGKPVAS